MKRSFAFLALAVVLSSCTGKLTQPGGQGAGRGIVGPDTGELKTPGAGCEQAALLPARLWRLTGAEYRASLRDVLELEAVPDVELEPEPVVAGFKNNAAALSVSSRVAEQLQKAAAKLAPQGLQTFASYSGCPSEATTDEACVRRFIASIGARAFRRPLSDEEASGYLAVYRAGVVDENGDNGVRLVVETLLQSPHFLYRSELGEAEAAAGSSAVALSSYELASALSYTFWGRPPDPALLSAAQTGALSDLGELANQAQRLLQDVRAEGRIQSFVWQWLSLREPDTLKRDPTKFPGFEAIKPDLFEEARFLSKQAFLSSGATLGAVFAAPSSLMTGGLLEHYGLSVPYDPAFKQIPLTGTGRLGLLTSGLLIASWSRDVDTAPMLRGKNLLNRVLCQALPPPPAELEIPAVPEQPGATTRERFEIHAQNPACAGCHGKLDAVAFAFEHFDSDGRYRSFENGKPIDASGRVDDGGDMSGAFTDVTELGQRLVGSRDARICLARQFVRFAAGTGEGSDNRCLLEALVSEAASHFDSPTALMTALVRADYFRLRQVEVE